MKILLLLLIYCLLLIYNLQENHTLQVSSELLHCKGPYSNLISSLFISTPLDLSSYEVIHFRGFYHCIHYKTSLCFTGLNDRTSFIFRLILNFTKGPLLLFNLSPFSFLPLNFPHIGLTHCLLCLYNKQLSL